MKPGKVIRASRDLDGSLQHPGDGRLGLLEDRLLLACRAPCHLRRGQGRVAAANARLPYCRAPSQ